MNGPAKARLLSAYDDGVASIGRLAERVADWSLSTPCEGWSCTDLAGHLLCIARYYHRLLDAALAGEPLRDLPRGQRLALMNATDLAALEDGPGAARASQFVASASGYRDRLEATDWAVVLGVWEEVGERSVGEHTGLAVQEWHVHAWDLARAIGADHRPHDASVVASARLEEDPTAAGADPWEFLLDAAGRSPDAEPPSRDAADGAADGRGAPWVGPGRERPRMVDVHRYHDISEATHRVMNPVSASKLELLGEICELGPGDRVLDLACGKGELLALFARGRGVAGVGVDNHPPFLVAARARAAALGVAHRVRFVEADAGVRGCVEGVFDAVCCVGATWIGGGLTGTLELMRSWLDPGGWLVVGECYWVEPPTEGAAFRHAGGEGFTDLVGTLGRFEDLDLDLVEMLLASPDEWDRYAASQWLNVSRWLDAHADDPDADAVRAERDESRRAYLAEDRRSLGWGLFVLRERGARGR